MAIATDGVKQFKKERYEVILIDTSGRHRQESGLLTEMSEITAAVNPDSTIFVMDGTQGQSVRSQAAAFNESVDVGSVIVTKLDGGTRGGGGESV